MAVLAQIFIYNLCRCAAHHTSSLFTIPYYFPKIDTHDFSEE